jgi:hypothetical protein
MAGFAAGAVGSTVIRSTWRVSLTVLAGSAVGVTLFVLIGVLVGQSQLLHHHPVVVVGVVSVANTLVAPPVVRLLRWALPPPPEHSYAKPPR